MNCRFIAAHSGFKVLIGLEIPHLFGKYYFNRLNR